MSKIPLCVNIMKSNSLIINEINEMLSLIAGNKCAINETRKLKKVANATTLLSFALS